MYIENGSTQFPIVPYNRVTTPALLPKDSLHQLQSKSFFLSKHPHFDVTCSIHWKNGNDVKLIPLIPGQASSCGKDSYDEIRCNSQEFKTIAIERNQDFENQMQGFLNRQFDAPKTEDLDEGLKLLKTALSIEQNGRL